METIQTYLTAAMESKALPQQELMHLKSGEEEMFKYALSKPQIKNSRLDELESVLRLIMLKIGLRAENLPSREEKAVIIDHILSTYGNHTIDELRLAFEMALTYKLNLAEKDIPCYENFTCTYISKIMNAYRQWASDAYTSIAKKRQPLLEDKTKLTDEEKAEWIMDWKNMPEINIDLIPLLFYDFLDSKGIINLTNTQKWEYTLKGVTYVKMKLQEAIGECKTNEAYMIYNKFKNQETDGFDNEFAGRIKNRAKRLIVYDYLKDSL